MPLDDQQPELRITLPNHQNPIKITLVRSLTTIGSDTQADLQLASLPQRWAVVQKTQEGALLRLITNGEQHLLTPGQERSIEGLRLQLCRQDQDDPSGLQVLPLVDGLSEAQNPEEALHLLLKAVIEDTKADWGALILREGEDYAVAVAMDHNGSPLVEASQLLSDHIVRQVLQSGSPIFLPDVSQDHQLAQVQSVVSLKLRSVLCVPMRLHQSVLGTIFLGKREIQSPFNPRQASDLSFLASMAVPLLIQLRRFAPGMGSAEPTLVGESEAMQKVRALIERVAPSDLSILVLGETGTGKELVARAIHAQSQRSRKPMVAINCAAVPKDLLEGELFGYKRGAFTGALADRKGRIEEAHQSTLFLDEVGDMPLPMQAALLRVLETHELSRLGENQARVVDFRLIAATHRDLNQEVAAGRFRQDLLFRLKEFSIALPRLEARGSDILLLASLFLRLTERDLHLPTRRLGLAAAQRLMVHAWPGNIRELRSTIRRAAILCDQTEIQPEHLDLEPSVSPPAAMEFTTIFDLAPLDRPLSQARDEFVARYIARVLEHKGGNREAAAASLGISIRSLYRHLAP